MQYIKSINPTNKKVIGKTKVSSSKQINDAVKKARLAFDLWSRIPLEKRIRILKKAARISIPRTRKFAKLLSLEMGKPMREALIEPLGIAQAVYYHCKHDKEILQGYSPKRNIVVKREPIGVVGVISPWNYPFVTTARLVIPALLAGNTVVFKPSESTTLCGIEFVKLLWDAGVPKDVLQIVIGADAVGKQLVKSDVDVIAFTGSTAAGKHIMKNSADKLHKLVLELGGKDAMIIADDFDPKKAADIAVGASFYNCGQICCSPERIYVHESISKEFIDEFVRLTKKIKVGDPAKLSTKMGPLVNEQQYKNFISHISDAKKKGAKILVGGKPIKNKSLKGYFHEPTVIVNVKKNMKILDEETFGPAKPIIVFKNMEEAVQLANDTKYGLTATIMSKDLENAEEIASRLEAGTVYINDWGNDSIEYPWGGWKESGIGRISGKEGIMHLTQTKTLVK